jgi:hypothetical protein
MQLRPLLQVMQCAVINDVISIGLERDAKIVGGSGLPRSPETVNMRYRWLHVSA